MKVSRPSLDLLISKVDSKYTLVVAAAKRARELMDGGEPMVASRSTKAVSISLEEMGEGKLFYERPKGGPK